MGLDELNSFADSMAPASTRYRSSMNYAADTEPDAHADLLKQSKALDVPPSLMPKKKGDQRRLAMSRDLDLLELPRRAPKTAEWFANPDNAMVAHDDHQSLSGIEQWFNEYAKKPAARFLTQLGIGADMLALPFLGDKNREYLMKRIEVMREHQKEAAADPATSFGGRLVQSLEELAPYLLMGPTGVPLLVAGATAGKGIELQERGITGPTQSALAALSGITAFGMTKIPMAQGSYLKSAAAGAGGNIALGVAERTIEKGILSATGFDKQAEETRILDPDTIASDIAMGILFGAHARHGQAKAEKQAATILAFADLVNKSKFKERYKPGFMDFIKQQAEGGELETIGMPVEKFEEFWQSSKKPLAELLTDPNAYHEAKVTGGDVVIPIEDFSANFAEHVNSMEHVMDLRLRPGDDTLREAQEAAKTEEKDIQEFLKSVQETEGEETKSSDQRVYDDVLGQLLGINIPREVAEKQAALWAIRQRTRAERVGGDAWDLYSEIPLEITRPLPEGMQPEKTVFDQLRPAVRMGKGENTVLKGEINQKHDDVLTDYGRTLSEGERGFIGKDGKFMTRDQAKAWVEKNQPEVFKRLPEGEMHSEPYAEAMKGAKELFDPNDPTILHQSGALSDKRGFIRIGQDKIQIGLLEKADLSTFVHESSHAWTEEFARDVKRETAPEELKADWEKLKQWAGFEGDEITVEAHEKIASGFEEYLKEGKAPSQELMPLFQRFSAWIKQVYRKLTGTGVTLTDDVRGVFDRMLATDQEIARAEDMQNLRPLFTDAKTAGMTEAEFAPYKKIAEKAHEENKNRLLVKMMDEMNREQKAWWKSEKETMRGAVTEEAQNNPVYQAFQFFAKGESWDGVPVDNPMKLSRDDLVKMYGEDFVKKLPRAFQRLYTREGGIHPDVAADMFGFGSGDEMIRKLAEAPKMERWIAAETDVRLREKYGDMMQDGSIAEEALKAVHGDETGQLLRAELRAIRRMQGTVKEFTKGKEVERDQFKKSIPPLKWFQAMAAQHIDTKSIRELKPDTYLRAEAKAAREAEEALGRQDFAKASEAKQRQLTNHYLYLEATKAMEDIDRKVMPYMKKMETKARLGTIGKAGGDYLDQIQGILSRYEFSKVPYPALDSERSLREYLDKFKEDYDREIPIDGRILDESRKANYREVPLNELFAAHDAVKSIEHAAKEVVKVQKEGQSVMMEDAREELISKLSDTHPEVKDLVTDPQLQNKFQKGFRTLKKLNADMTRVEFLIERMDGGKQGPWHDYFWNRYLNAETRKLELLDMIHEPLKKLVDDMPAEQRERLASREPIHIKTMGEAFSRQRLFSILMNMGNESNRDKLMRGGIIQGEGNREFSQEAIDEIMGHFTKADFDMAQGLWDTVDKLLPEVKSLHKRWTGLDFPEIARTPLQTPYGEYSGGYWPIKYDARASGAGEKQQAETAIKTVQDLFGFSTGKPSTSQGYTKERTAAAYPLMLDWKQVATRHISEVATDLAYREFVDQANRMLKHTDIKRQMQVRAGEYSNDIMQKWLRGMVGGDSWGQASHSAADEIYKAGYSHFTTAVLGLNIAGAMADIAAQQMGAFTRVRGDYMLKAYADFAMNPKKFAEFVEEKSTWRHHIEKQVDQSIQNSMDYLAAHPTKWNDLMRMTLSMRVWMYKITGNIAWTAAYNEAMEQGQIEKEAIRIADKVQRMTEHAGDIGSISAMERHPLWKKLLVYAGPMEVAYNAMMNNLIEIKNKKGAAPEALGKFFVMWMAQSVVWAAVRGKKEEEESWAGFIARHAALGPFEAFPILRDLVPYAEKKMLGKHASTRGLAITAPFQATIDALSSDYRAATGEGDMAKAVKDTNIAAGMVLGYPSVQLDITGQYIYDVLTGQYSAKHPWSFVTDALWRRKKE